MGVQVDSDFGLCGDCWRDTPFIGGLVCDACGVPLPGKTGDAPLLCDDCLAIAAPLGTGARGACYRDNAGKKLVLGLKHGDARNLARPAGPVDGPRGAPI